MADLPPGFEIEPPPQASADLPPGFVPDTPDLFNGLTNTAARWATFGLTDPVAAGTHALAQRSMGNPESWGDLYNEKLAALRGQSENFATAHPYANAAAATAGALTAGGPRALPPQSVAAPAAAAPSASLFGRMGLGATTGAGIGAAGGLSNSQNTDALGMAKDAGLGAVGGAAVGGAVPAGAAVLARPVSALARMIVPNAVQNQGTGLLASRMAQDAAAGGPNATAIDTGLNAAGGSPLSIADLGGENVQALAGRLARTQGELREIATQFLADRNAGMAPRLIQSIDQNLSGGNAFQAAGSLMAQRKADAGPLYQAAYAYDALNPDTIAAGGELDNMMSRPSMQNAAQRAMSIAQEEGRDPTSLGITFNEAGDPKFEKVPSWQTLDYVKRGLDDVVNQSRDPLTGRLVLDEAGNAVNSTRKAFLNFLDENNPPYAAARQAWAGPTESLAAMKQGQNFRQMRPELIDQQLSRMSPSEQEFFRLGAADSLRTAVGQTGTASPLIGSNAVNNRGADYLQQQLRPLFPSDDAFNRFTQNASNENLIFANTNRFVGNSATAARVAEDRAAAGHGASTLANLFGAGSAFFAGEPIAGTGMLARALAGLNNVGEVNNPRVNAAAARMLYSSDPAQNANTLAAIMARRPSPIPAGIAAPGSYIAGSLYPRYELLPGEKPKTPPPNQ
jgi:hypothetical protein